MRDVWWKWFLIGMIFGVALIQAISAARSQPIDMPTPTRSAIPFTELWRHGPVEPISGAVASKREACPELVDLVWPALEMTDTNRDARMLGWAAAAFMVGWLVANRRLTS